MKLIGSHSLMAWGLRLSTKQNTQVALSSGPDEMQKYGQGYLANLTLYNKIMSKAQAMKVSN